ncbi:MAG: hypothetical protein ACYC8T_35620 [Myxococcaceae bacterium]
MAAGEERRKNALILSRVRRVQRALNGEVWLRAAVAPAWVAVTLLALARIFFRSHLPFAAAVLGMAALAVWVSRARKGLWPLSHAAVLADRSGGLGGLLLTRLEVPVGEWELEVNERVRAVKPPEVRWGKSAAALSMAALFLGVSLLVPLPPPAVLHVNAAAASKVAEVEAKADALAREDRLDAATEAELARLREELAEDRFDAADWEAADGVEAAMEQQAAQAAADLSRASEAAKALEAAMAQAGGAEGAAREQEELERALQSISEGGEPKGEGEGQQGSEGEKGSEGEQGSEGQQGGAQNPQSGSGKKGPTTAGGVSSLRKALENRQKELANAFGQQQGQSGSRQASRGQGGKGEQGQGREQGQSGNGQGQEGKGEGEGQGEGAGQSGEGQSGQGHASRGQSGAPVHGGGEGELVFGDQARMDPDRLKFAPLPQGQGGEAQELWGLRAADPRVREGPSGGTASGAAASGEQAPGFKEGPLLPRNRELLKRYFDSTR